MAEHRGEQPIGIPRIDDDLRDLLAVAQAEVCPGLARVDRLVNPVPHGEVGPLQSLARGDVDDVWVGFRHRDRPDRTRGLVVEDRRPGPAVVVGLPDAAVADADIEHARLRGDAGDGPRPAGPERADRTPAHPGKGLGVDGLGQGAGRAGREEHKKGEGDLTESVHGRSSWNLS